MPRPLSSCSPLDLPLPLAGGVRLDQTEKGTAKAAMNELPWKACKHRQNALESRRPTKGITDIPKGKEIGGDEEPASISDKELEEMSDGEGGAGGRKSTATSQIRPPAI